MAVVMFHAPLVSGGNKPIVEITLRPHASHSTPEGVSKEHSSYTAPITDHDPCILSTVCDLFINCDLVMDDFSRQILIKSSVTSLDLK